MIRACKLCSDEYKTYNKNSSFCSNSCYHKSMEKKVTIICGNCNSKQERWPSRIKKNSKNCFCSKECQYAHQSGENSNLYNEGDKFNCNTSGFVFVLNEGVFRSEHRVVVEGIIKRKLNYYGNPILHINGIKSDNKPSNLYVCENNSEMATIIHTLKAPYPYKSNINSLL